MDNPRFLSLGGGHPRHFLIAVAIWSTAWVMQNYVFIVVYALARDYACSRIPMARPARAVSVVSRRRRWCRAVVVAAAAGGRGGAAGEK